MLTCTACGTSDLADQLSTCPTCLRAWGLTAQPQAVRPTGPGRRSPGRWRRPPVLGLAASGAALLAAVLLRSPAQAPLPATVEPAPRAAVAAFVSVPARPDGVVEPATALAASATLDAAG